METILNLLAVSTAGNALPHSAKIQAVTERFLSTTPNAALMSNDMDAWRQVTLPFPLIVTRLDSHATLHLPVAAFILDLRDPAQRPALAPFNRDPSARFVVVGTEPLAAEHLAGFGKHCHVLVVLVAPDDIHVSLLSKPCEGIGGVGIRDAPVSLHCTANMSFMDFPPNVISLGDRIAGFEGLMAQTASDHIGLELQFVNRHETEWGKFDPPTGLMGDVGSGRSLAGFGAFYAFPMRWMNADLVYGCSTVQLAWAVPVHAGPRHPTWFVILVSELSWPVWACSLAAYLGLVAVSSLIGCNLKHSVSWPFHNLGLLLGSPQRLVQRRTLTMTIIVFGFILTSYYQTMMSSKLTAPDKIPEIKSLKELAESGLRFQGPPTAGDVLKAAALASPGDSGRLQLSRGYEPVFSDLRVILPRIALQKDVAYLRHGANINFHAQKDPRTAGNIHVVEEPTLTFMPVTLMDKASCLVPRFQQLYDRLSQSGLCSKWLRDSEAVPRAPPPSGPIQLSFEHIYGFLLLLLFGWAMAFVAFCGELAYYQATMRKKVTSAGK